MVRSGYGKRRTLYRAGLIALLAVGFLMPAPVLADPYGRVIIGGSVVGVVNLPLLIYGIWENLPSRQGKERLLNGEWYAGGYMGGAFYPGQDIRLDDGAFGNRASATLFNNKFGTSVVGGVKLGYFSERIPYLGIEEETNISRSPVRSTSLSVSRPIQGFNQVIVPNDDWLNLIISFHIVGRYGFLKDKEVPFGRLQPYVGFGPAGVIRYDSEHDHGKYGIDVMAGVRYMLLKQVSLYVEYKYTHAWAIPWDSRFTLPNGVGDQNTANVDFVSHKVVLGAAYHW